MKKDLSHRMPMKIKLNGSFLSFMDFKKPIEIDCNSQYFNIVGNAVVLNHKGLDNGAEKYAN